MDRQQQRPAPGGAKAEDGEPAAVVAVLPDGVRRAVPRLLGEVRTALGDELLGMYLYGSAVSGDFDEGISDVDLVVALAGMVDRGMLRRLESAHCRFWQAHPDFVDRIDLVYVPAAVLAGPPAYDGGLSLLASVSPGSPLHTTAATRDWVLNWQLALQARVTVAGRPVESVVRPISAGEIRAVVASQVQSMRQRLSRISHRGGQAYLVLTICRAVLTLTTGGQASKAGAARWASSRWPHLQPVIDAALEWRRASAVRDETPVPAGLAAQINDLLMIAEELADGVDQLPPAGQ